MKRPKSAKSKKASEEFKKKIKRRFYELEEYTGFNRSDVATACDVRIQTIGPIYNGKVDIQGSTTKKIANEVYGIEDYEFLQEGYFPKHIKKKPKK